MVFICGPNWPYIWVGVIIGLILAIIFFKKTLGVFEKNAARKSFGKLTCAGISLLILFAVIFLSYELTKICVTINFNFV